MRHWLNGLLTVGLTAALTIWAAPTGEQLPSPDPYVTLLDMHPVTDLYKPSAQMALAMPRVVRRGDADDPDQRQIQVPAVVTPSQPSDTDASGLIGKAGTGFFIGEDGTLLTAAHVASGCGRMQIISRYVPRTWVSLAASDETHDVAILKAPGLRPPAVARLAASAPASGKLFILGFPATANLTTPAETWGVVENEKFPGNIGSLTDPRDLLWLSAPGVAHGYSGGPIYDPRSGGVVGLVKGEVEGGYLRLVRDMPTSGVAIGPGIAAIDGLLHREVPYTAVSLVAAPGETGIDTLRRATVHVLCWH